ncbi:glycosyltransferase [Photobacterium sp. DA100]|uniref:glycosyltransferase n=1 Tax=Photobacterium sp. DA100 TaxID=3027472 RepID=UPI0024794D69|nr:glycosyltransferase [Photobacterium sp. DA100]WEM42437.1 glycosyltransferase [Photobacterium sp. DA100]
MKRKAVLVVSALRGGGAEKFVLNLYKALEKYENFECHILAIEKAVQHDIAGFRVHFASDICNVSKKGWRRLFYKKNVAKAIDDFVMKNIGEDALVLSNMLLADKIMSYSKLNVFHVIHNSYSTSLLKGKNKLNQLRVIVKTNNIYKNHPLVFVSEASKESYFKKFKSHKDNHVIYNPIDLDEIFLLSNNFSSDIDGDYIIHVGRFNRAKRHDRLISIFSEVKNKNIKLALLGDGDLKAEVLKKVSELNLENRVIFLGFKDNPYPYIKSSKALVLTSDFEGLPTVLLEAMALQVPVISMKCPGGIDEIIDIETHSICPFGDNSSFAEKIDDVVENPNNYLSLVRECFHPEQVAKKYGKLK